MKKRTTWILFGSFWALLLLVGWAKEITSPQSATSAVATAQAVDGLIRSTRKGGGQRDPFVLQEGQADPKQERQVNDDLETAIVLMQEKDYAGAIPLLERVIKQTPTIEATWEALGWSYYHTGRVEEADKLWQQYLSLRPESPKAYSLLAQLSILRNDWKATDKYLSGSLALEPDDYDIRYWYAQNLFRLGRLDAALAILEKLVREDDQRFDVKMDLARIYTLVQRYEDSLDLWTAIVDALPDNLEFRTEYARALMLVGNLEEADEQARRILTGDSTLWPAMNLRADIAEISQRPEVMVESLRTLIQDAKDPNVRAKLQVRLGVRLLLLNRKDPVRWPMTLALAPYADAIEVETNNVPWLNQYAQIAMMAHQPVKARQTIDRILKDFNPFNQLALSTRFELEMLAKDFNAAEKALDEQYDSYQPDSPYRFLELARLEVQRGRYQGALDALDLLEETGNQGAVLTLLYHGLTESEWMALTSTRRLREHLLALRQAGYTFISPMDIPEYLKNNRVPPPRSGPKPWLARQVDNVHYAFTGEQRTRKLEDIRPEKVVAITFDDGLRSTFSLGTPIGQELGITFGIFVLTNIEELNAPMYAAWEEVRSYMDTGTWEIGSHLLFAHTPRPVGPNPKPEVFPLVNRLWNTARNRLETMREWSIRVQNEFSESRSRLEKFIGLSPRESMAVAYPYGEIGQEEGSNIARILNPIRTVLNEASRYYQVGFVLDQFGYTCASDNILMVRRYEPSWDADADAVVEYALANHPVFIARRLRAEIATLMDKPYLAEKQIELLRRDGYPDKLLRDLIAYTQNRTPAALAAPALDETNRGGTSRMRVRPSNVYVGGDYRENRSSKQILQQFVDARGGLNLTSMLGLEISYQSGTIDQTVTSNFWYKIDQSETSSSVETRNENLNGTNSTSVIQVSTTTTREVQTNRIDKYQYAADVEEIRGALTLRIHDSASLTATLGQKSLLLRPRVGPQQSESEIVGSLVMAWRPFRTLQIVTMFDHNIVPSARRKISDNVFALNTLWKVTDDWDLACKASYLSYEDDNSMVQLSGSSFWQLFERQGIWGGLEASSYSMDEKSELYWCPYWDTRFLGVARLRRAYQDYFFQFDIRLGMQSEQARPEDDQAYLNLKAKADKDGNWYPGPDPAADWATYVGLGCTYRQRLWRHLDLIGNLSVNFLRDYAEHDFTIGLQYNF